MTPTALQDLFAQDTTPALAATASYLQALKAHQDAQAALQAASRSLQEAEATLLAQMAQRGVKSVCVGGQTLSLSQSVYYAAPAGCLDDASFYKWLLVNRGHDLVRRGVDALRFRRFCRELAEAGKPLHPLVRVAVRKKVRVKGES